MEQFVRISNINDFMFCPKSLYLHAIYENFDNSVYHDQPQIVGSQMHAAVDEKRYSSSKHILQGLSVASVEFGLLGKIDIYDANKKSLVERKTKVKILHEGYRLQLYAQYVCMIEMGYDVWFMFIHSIQDNKRYAILPPGKKELKQLRYVLGQMRRITPAMLRAHSCKRCQSHIYESLGW